MYRYVRRGLGGLRHGVVLPDRVGGGAEADVARGQGRVRRLQRQVTAAEDPDVSACSTLLPKHNHLHVLEYSVLYDLIMCRTRVLWI